MYTVRYGGKTGKRYNLSVSDDCMVVRSKDRGAMLEARPFEVTTLSAETRRTMNEMDMEVRFSAAGVEVWRAKVQRGARSHATTPARCSKPTRRSNSPGAS